MNTTLTSRVRVALAGGAFALALAACGGDPAPLSAPAEAAAESTVAPDATAAPTTAADVASAGPVDAAVKISQTELGEVLADPSGKTVYAFTNDVEAVSTCYGTCAEAWPPVIVDADFLVSPGLDSGIFATTERDDGQLQLVAGKFPLYLYAADAKPGDLTGHGVGDVWFAVDLDGRLATGSVGTTAGADVSDEGDAGTDVETDAGTDVETDAGTDVETDTGTDVETDAGTDVSVDADGDVDVDDPYGGPATDDAGDTGEQDAPADVPSTFAVSDSGLGTILTDSDGRTLYLFTEDEAGEPTCADGCAQAWPPLLVDGPVVAPDGVDPALLSTVEHPNGGTQLKIGKWPLYLFASDSAPGDTNGQGSGGVWFVVGTDGLPIN